jgi:hypothetical protein
LTTIVVSREHGLNELIGLLVKFAGSLKQLGGIELDWGAIAWVGDGISLGEKWLIVGEPSRDPWGWPGNPLSAEEIESRLTSFSGLAGSMTSGPFLAVDTRDGSLVVAANGIIPFYLFRDESGLSSNNRAFLGFLHPTGMSNLRREVPFGSDILVKKRRTDLRGDKVRAELIASAPGPIDARLTFIPGHNNDIWDNSARTIWHLNRLRTVELSERWWKARDQGIWLHAPCSERPLVDLLIESAP